jgi:ribose transport system permease protein
MRGGRWLTGALGPLLAFAVVVIGFGVAINLNDHQNTFFNLRSLRLIASETSMLAIPALGMTMIVIAGGIDLSVGMATSLAAVLMAVVLKNGGSPVTAISVALATGIVIGAINGMLISVLRLVPFIATLGMMSITFGVAKMIAGESGKVLPDREQVPEWLSLFSPVKSDWVIPHVLPAMPVGVWLLLVLSIGLAAILHRTVFGRYVFAIGSSEATARLCGINVPAMKIAIYALAGLFVGIRGMISFSELSSGDCAGHAGRRRHHSHHQLRLHNARCQKQRARCDHRRGDFGGGDRRSASAAKGVANVEWPSQAVL